jgi:hypothetical protein
MRTLFLVFPAILPVLSVQDVGRAVPASRPVQSRPAESRPAPDDDVLTRDASKPGDIPAPQGASPEDIRAMQGAKAMLEAEVRLKRLLQEGKIKGVDKLLTFEDISSWPYEDGLKGMPDSLRKLDGQKVMMTGFMLPIDEVENISKFLLVQSLWSCCFGQPPDVNGLVRVEMQGRKRVEYQYDPIRIIGILTIKANYDDDYCTDVYTLKAESVEVIH